MAVQDHTYSHTETLKTQAIETMQTSIPAMFDLFCRSDDWNDMDGAAPHTTRYSGRACHNVCHCVDSTQKLDPLFPISPRRGGPAPAKFCLTTHFLCPARAA